MENNNLTEQKAAQAILDRGIRYTLGKDQIVLRPLRFGTILMICEVLCRDDLTQQVIEEYEKKLPAFFIKYQKTMLECVAIAITNSKKELENNRLINKKINFLRDNLTAFQLYELFVYMINFSGMQAFTSTIRLALMMKTANLSPRVQGS